MRAVRSVVKSLCRRATRCSDDKRGNQGAMRQFVPDPKKTMLFVGDKEITMKARWFGVTGAVLVLTALVLGTLGPRLLPTAFWSNAPVSLNGPGMMGNGMVGGNGMMGPGMMSG